MSLWTAISSFFGTSTSRSVGKQSEEPSAYAAEAAAAVNTDSALQLSTVWACVRLITETVSFLPLKMWRIENGVRVLETKHPIAQLLSFKPNRWQTTPELFETLTFQLMMTGNCFAAKEKSGDQVIALTPLMSEQVEVELLKSGNVQYTFTSGTEKKIYNADDILHIKLFGNGIIGLSPLAYARNSLGIGIAAENAVTKIYKNDSKRSGAIELPVGTKTTSEQKADIRTAYSSLSSGDSRLIILDQGAKFNPISLSPLDIELLASRRFQIEDIARFFGVPSVLVNDTSASTSWGSGIQQIIQGFYKFGLRPYLERYEAVLRTSLLDPKDWRKYEFEFDFNSLLLPDMLDRIKMYKEGVQGGIMTPNEGRTLEGWEVKKGGDSLYVQRQMVALEDLGKVTGVVNENKESA
jgi:HK97 family phage portal protein